MAWPHNTPDSAAARYRHPLVRDLAWLVHAPDLLITRYAGRPTLDELGLADPAYRHDWLAALERDPARLETTLDTRRAGRLGLYHETLWHFLLAQAPATRLLGANLTIHDARGATLGELDLIYAHHTGGAPVHVELAIKYYLGLPEGPGKQDDAARWIGPGCADSLAIKRQHALVHQLPLAGRPEAAATLERFAAPPLDQRLAMLGVLFRPWSTTSASLAPALPLPLGAATHTSSGEWLRRHDWSTFCACIAEPRSMRGALLDKPHWLAPPPDGALLTLTELTQRLEAHFDQRSVPRQLVLRDADGHYQRIFVVADDWPRAIPLPPKRT